MILFVFCARRELHILYLLQDPKGNAPCENGVRFSELVDVSLRCVFGFCKEPIYKDVVRNIQAIQLFKNTLSFFAHQENKGQTENIVKLATAIIEFICIADLEGAYIIFREGLEETVINLTNHPNQKIGSYSTALYISDRIPRSILFTFQ